MIVTIDGPAGSGKSTTARAVADQLGFRHLDSGALYRALTYAALQANLPEGTWDGLNSRDIDALGVTCEPSGRGFTMRVGSAPVTDALRAERVTARVSHMASIPAVRQWLLARQRWAARQGDLVADGRDMGTVVFPEAELKVYLVARPETRARRRLAERGLEAPSNREVEAESSRIIARDRADSERDIAPLRAAPDAVEIDTSDLSFQEQVTRIVQLAHRRRSRPT